MNDGGYIMEKKSNELYDWLKAIIIAALIALAVRTFLFSPIIVDGPSMQPTLYDRDQMIVNKFIYKFKQPERFDIVIFHASESKDFIKRVIGLPGEHIKVIDNELYVNNEKMVEPFFEDFSPDSFYTNDFSLEMLPGNYDTIPDGHVLVLGDNRSNSTDSRSIGLIDTAEIVGKASVIYWPFKRIQLMAE